MAYNSISELIKIASNENKPLWKIIQADDMKDRGVSAEDSLSKMQDLWSSIKSASADYDSNLRSPSKLSGGDGGKMIESIPNINLIGDSFMAKVIAEALKTGESNACMRRIVAAPTAGSCGVLPAVFIPLAKRDHIEDEHIIHALYVAAGFGAVIATRATIAGAEGGCQAEIGAASSMAAAALVALRGGTPLMSSNACAIALKNLLGLTCDPVAGLVEVPCIKRNVIGAVNAISSADMALAGIESKIPADEVIDAMRAIGILMPSALKETSEAGLAQTPTGIAIAKTIVSESNW